MQNRRRIVVLLCDDDPNSDQGNAAHRAVLEQCFSDQKPEIESEILTCRYPDEIELELERPEAAGGIDLALIDAYYTRRWVGGEFKTAEGEVDRSGEIVAQYGQDPRIRKLILLTGKPRELESQEALLRAHAYEYWHKNDFITYGAFKRKIEELLDLPSRYDLDVFQDVFSRGIYADRGFNFAAARNEVDTILIGKSLAMRRLKRLIFEASQFDEDVPVLITGETGTGKELVANLIHRLSSRGRVMHRDDPVTINCGLFYDENLLRAELFGTHRGAFTGAIEREGILEAHKGTSLFLDEVGNSHERFQATLLRAIENREGARLGSSRSNEYKIELRFIAATDRDIDDPLFSRPFVNRIRGLHLHIPPLRERREDIGLLADFFLTKPVDGTSPKLTLAARLALEAYDWPGNVRQLRHVMEIVRQRASRLRTTTDRQTTSLIYRDEIEVLFSARAFAPPSDVTGDIAPLIAGNPSYSEACDRFAEYYVRSRHQQIAGGERSNAAYDRTAAALGVSRSTVKKWLSPSPEES
ncbi:MAG TPA: sigma 54-interacting transcriptional regulator [Beijerinckiaceae bacterium]|jgi:DNA-binding NtrC family response regulator